MSKGKEKTEASPNETPEVSTEVPAPDGDGPGVADLDTITDQLVGASPKPNAAAIEAAGEKQDAQREAFADLRDSRGNRFDPEIHVTDSEGNPKLTAKKKLRLRPGRKPGSTAKVNPALGAKLPTQQGMTHQQRIQARATGDAAANALIMLGVIVGGDEWNPVQDEQMGVDEKANLSHAFGDYFEAKEMTDIPPGVALTIAITAYVVPRFTMPKTQTRMQRFKEWIATKIAKRRMRKNGNGPQSNTRDDRERENDTSERISEAS